MTGPRGEQAIRAAALAWLTETTLGGTEPVSRERLANDFQVDGTRFPLIDRGRGIRKPHGWHGASGVTTPSLASGCSARSWVTRATVPAISAVL